MKNYIILGLSVIVVILFLLRGCNKPLPPKEIVIRTTDTIVRIDTIIDTLTFYHTNIIPSKVDTVFLNDSNTFKYKYYYPINDSLLNGSIIALSNDRPQIDFRYTLKNYATNSTILIKDSVYKEVRIDKNKLYLGSEVLVSPMLSQAYIGASFEHKRGHLFNIDLGIDFNTNNKLIKVGYKRKLKLWQKGKN